MHKFYKSNMQKHLRQCFYFKRDLQHHFQSRCANKNSIFLQINMMIKVFHMYKVFTWCPVFHCPSFWGCLQYHDERCALMLSAGCPPAADRFRSPVSGCGAFSRRAFHSLPLFLWARDLTAASELGAQIPGKDQAKKIQSHVQPKAT